MFFSLSPIIIEVCRYAGIEHLKNNNKINLTSIMITGLTILAFISEDKVMKSFEKLRVAYVIKQNDASGGL